MALGIKFAPLFIPLRRRLQTAAVFYYCSNFLFSGTTVLIFLLYLLFTPYYYLSLIYLGWWIFDQETPVRGGRRWHWFRRLPMWRWFAEYFPVKLIKTTDLPADRNYIFGMHPHGILCFSHFVNFGTEGTNFSQLFPGITPHLITLNFQFLMPLQREQFSLTGACSASKESLEFILSKKKGTGNAVGLIIGGAREVLDTIPNTMILTLKKRRGYAKVALENGASLVPVISFGENELYQTMHHEEMTIGRKIQEKLYKLLTFTPPLFLGRGIFQYSFGIMPFRKEVFTVVGRPIFVEKTPHPTDSQVDELHEKYLKELTNLYEENKMKYGYGDIPLKIK
ncbi:2-acylglycerol O-acyltransferase 2-A isoform X1 [Dermatophagoides farinae]|uniref:Acyltransferase n=1 Tax=Dermatophagoides farinae TaxID=6954 RepID=A0A9D4SGU5_DERFA|nr:2-acylglycerol O-acyltransferase 2-A-like [Dermatophagoides farinae]KAH7641153.1 2-acylglycerol o-acyltransferase 1-like [Dermatophagoides farinae]